MTEIIGGEHIASNVPDVDVREDASQHGPPGAVLNDIGQIAGEISHKPAEGAWESLLGLRFGVHGVAEYSCVDSHEGVQDGDVG